MTDTANTLDQHLRGPWVAYLADNYGYCYPTVDAALEELSEDDEVRIGIARGTAVPTERDGGLRLPGSYETGDQVFEMDVFLVGECDDESTGAAARWAQAQAMADGLNHAGEVERLRTELFDLRDDLHAAQPVLDAAYALEEARTDPATNPADTRTALDVLYDAVEAHRLMGYALDAGRRERAEEQGSHPCDCCYVDGHTRRCGRVADTEDDVAPFGILAVAQECKDRINGTAVTRG